MNYAIITIVYLIVVIDIIRHYRNRLKLKDQQLIDVREELLIYQRKYIEKCEEIENINFRLKQLVNTYKK